MRNTAVIALGLLLVGCALPFGLKWPRMPWHKPSPAWCIVSLETGSTSGIATGQQARDSVAHTACDAPPQARRGVAGEPSGARRSPGEG